MKQRTALVAVMLTILFSLLPFSLNAQKINYGDSWGTAGLSIKEESSNKIHMNFSINNLEITDVTIKETLMKNIQLPGSFLPNNAGAPDLPGQSRFIALPNGAVAKVVVNSVRTEVIKGIDIAPAPVIPKDNDRNPMVYEKDSKIYNINKNYPENIVQLSEQSEIRGINSVILGITPFQYNPVSKELTIYRDVDVTVNFEGGNGEFGKAKYRNRWWDPTLKNIFLNYTSLPEVNNNVISKSLTSDFEYVIISPDNPTFLAWADSIKNFRNAQGIRTGVVTLTQVGGNTTTAIENYINTAYNTWTVPPSAVLLLGDYGTDGANGTNVISPIYNSYCKSDNLYADVNGDHMPDVVLARILANNETQLSTIIGKILKYERNPPTNPSFYDKPITAMGWQTERWFQLCSEIVNGFWTSLGKHPVRENAIYQGTPGGAWSSATNTTTVVNYFGPTGLNYIPSTSAGLTDWGGSAARINNDINSGAFMLQHRDHGAENAWGEPSYTNSNIAQLNNTDLPFVLSINCLTGKFDYSSECFAEAFARSTKGAVGLLAATEVSYSFVNDAYLWGVFDEMWPNFMPANGSPNPVRIMPAFGNAAGKYFLKQSSWPYNTENKEVTYYLFHHLGDAFQAVYSDVPQNLTVSHNPVIISGQSSFPVTANTNALIALSKNGEILSTATGTGAPVNLTIPVLIPGDVVTVTVTCQNYYRYSQQLQVVPSEGAYVVQNGYVLNDSTGNINGLADYGETVKLSLKMKNVGNQPASNVNVTLSTSDSYAVVLDSTEVYGTIDTAAVITKANGFTVKLNNNIPDLHIIPLTVKATDGVNTWTSNISITAHAPVLTFTGYNIVDSSGNNNNRIDPGESFKVYVVLKNTGTAKALNVQGAMSTTSPYITMIGSLSAYGDLDTNAVVTRPFTANALTTAPNGQQVQFDVAFSGNLGIAGSGSISTFIGKIPAIIIDKDENHNSASAIKSTFDSLGISSIQVVQELPADLSLYKSVFVCLGVYSNNYALSAGEGTALANYLTQGGMLYMEGGDTWYYDTKTAVHPMFKITGLTDGGSDLGAINGQTGTFTQGMSFTYSGDNNYIDHITPTTGSTAYTIFQNSSPSYMCAVAYNGGSYNTIGSSFEFGGIPAASGVRTSYLNKILTMFNVVNTPVELTSLTANTDNNNVRITWETATETNNNGFDIERSADNKTFVKIGFVKGNGTSTERHQYSFVDNSVMNSSKFYYRLKQVDLDGTSEYSDVVEVDYSNIPKQFSLSQNYPNPFNPSTTIQFAVPKECNVTLKVYDVLGKEVTTLINDKMKPGYYRYQFNASNLASGIYFYRIEAGTFNAVKKLMLLK